MSHVALKSWLSLWTLARDAYPTGFDVPQRQRAMAPAWPIPGSALSGRFVNLSASSDDEAHQGGHGKPTKTTKPDQRRPPIRRWKGCAWDRGCFWRFRTWHWRSQKSTISATRDHDQRPPFADLLREPTGQRRGGIGHAEPPGLSYLD